MLSHLYHGVRRRGFPSLNLRAGVELEVRLELLLGVVGLQSWGGARVEGLLQHSSCLGQAVHPEQQEQAVHREQEYRT